MRKNRSPARVVCLLCAACCVRATDLAAQVVPDAGRLLRDEAAPLRRPPAQGPVLPEPTPAETSASAPDDGPSFELRGFHFRGNASIDGERLQSLLRDLVGQRLGLAALHAATGRITALYRREGFLLARAYLAPHDIVDGIVELTITEGFLGHLRLDNRSTLADECLLAYLQDLHEGAPLRSAPLERGLLLINQLAGIHARSLLEPGATPGSADLIVQVRDLGPPGPVLSVDNYGNHYSGIWRLGVEALLNNPSSVGDVFGLRLSSVGSPLRDAQLSYQRPVGARGWQAGVAWSGMAYRLTQEFAALGANGSASVGTAFAQYSLLRSRQANVQLVLGASRKRLVDRLDASGLRSEKRIDGWSLGLFGDAYGDGGAGSQGWSLALNGGNLSLDADSATLDAQGPRTAGHYLRLNGGVSGQWALSALSEEWRLAGRASAQRALRQHNLDSSEKLSLGGPQGVRAYPQGEAPCDDALLLNLELRWQPNDRWLLATFIDGAAGRPNDDPISAMAENRRRLSGFGLSAAHTMANGLEGLAMLAWPTGDHNRSAPSRSPQLWASLRLPL